MTSALTWMAYDEEEDEELRRLVAALKDSEARDPLGYGTLRDAIADVLFPGVSTVMTRARYFLFIPRLCMRLEEEGLVGDEFARRRRAAEIDLIHALLDGGHAAIGDGIIGGRAKDGTKQLASAVYWGGLGTLGIRRVQRSRARYERDLATIYRRRQRGSADSTAVDTWDPDLRRVSGPDGFGGRPTDMSLTVDEADYLTERIQLSQPASLFASMMAEPRRASHQEVPWGSAFPVPPRTRRILHHAEMVSLALHGAQLAYNHELSLRAIAHYQLEEDTEVAVLRDEMDALLGEWVEEVWRRQDELVAWGDRLDELWQDLGLAQRRMRVFFDGWFGTAGTDPETAAWSPEWRDRLAHRELTVKRELARLSSRGAQRSWTDHPAPQASARLDFRWSTVKILLADVEEGLSRATTR